MDYSLHYTIGNNYKERSFSSHKMLQQFVRINGIIDFSCFYQGKQYVVVGRSLVFQSDMVDLIRCFGVQWVKVQCQLLTK
jgi:hypothetical protein